MKKFVFRLFLFILIIVVCDVFVGIIGKELMKNAKGGNTARRYNVAYRVETDMVIFGSSRALHHYDPDIMEDTLGLSAYNCGLSGEGIICTYGYYKMLSKRYCPAIIAYEVSASDLTMDDNHKYLGDLRFFYDDADVASIFRDVDSAEQYKMLSQMYRYNSEFQQMIIDNIYPLQTDNKGYRTLNKEMKYVHKPDTVRETFEYDSLKLEYLNRLIEDCKGKSTLIFTISPLYGNTSEELYAPLKKMCAKYDVPLINHYTDTAFNNHTEYFADGVHLNPYGATAYSKTVAHEIKGILAGKADSAARGMGN